ncbi:IDEAL domain-containing protein [Guptibacillus algicola]|uniref:IDEAL domain-containing protein n=1 Tax=Guptibacillus algicola TaxID=225844 RepID=UPI001CD37BF0|nr:IDEAL domain-containing protein [Alkalihalobacillus algicola]MCA0986738.1 IDEAL domain-containing protein [Alkalihalobacillus algicola]
MMNQLHQQSQFTKGEWVKGKSVHDELVKGFVDSVNDYLGTIKIYVHECDNPETVGKVIETFQNRISVLEEQDLEKDETYILNLIDLALITKDKEWFLELSTQLNEIRNGSEEAVAC